MPDEKAKVGGKKAPPKPDEKPGHETVAAPFDDIIDAILGADPKAVRKHQERRRSLPTRKDEKERVISPSTWKSRSSN